MAKKTKPARAWLDGAVEVPRENVVANKDRAKRQKFYRRFIIASVILFPISLGVNILSFGAMNREAPPAAVSSATHTEGKAAAILAVQTWLASARSPLPGGGQLVSWDGFDNVKKPAQSADEKNRNPLPAYALEIHHFTLVDSDGITYQSDLQVAVDPKTGPHVIGTPSLVPFAIATDGGSSAGSSPWFGYGQVSAPAPVKSAIKAWAKAFTSGDPDALRLAVQDASGKHTYVPLYNVASFTIDPQFAAFIPGAKHDPSKPVVSGSRMLVQVSLTIQWDGAAELDPGEAAPTVTYDLLVDKVGGGAPYVIAWGGPGTGPSLHSHGNALSGRDIVSAPKASTKKATAPTTTSTPTPAPTGATNDFTQSSGE